MPEIISLRKICTNQVPDAIEIDISRGTNVVEEDGELHEVQGVGDPREDEPALPADQVAQ